jgi:two-component system CheB/CheR fusion protein
MSTSKLAHATLREATDYAGRYWSKTAPAAGTTEQMVPVVFVIDGNDERRETLRRTLDAHAFEVRAFSDSQAFSGSQQSVRRGCLLVDVSTPGAGGIEFIGKVKAGSCGLSVIAMATRFSPARVVRAMKAGASDCLERPMTDDDLLSALERVIGETDAMVDTAAFRSLAIQRVATLTARQREVLDLITTGHPSKNIAADLQISQRTVENHRAAIAKKTCSKSLSEVVHTAICANCSLMKVRH